MKINKLFNKPKIISVCGDVNTGKSNLIYHLIEELRKEKEFNLYTYGLKNPIKNSQRIYSVAELEKITDSFIIVDECFSLFDLDNRKQKQQIEKTLRLINHNNNILLLGVLPENLKKFLSGKIDVFLFKKSTYEDFINGSNAKRIALDYKGAQAGSKVLDLKVNECVVYDGKHYNLLDIPYYKEYDSKLRNEDIFKNVPKNVPKNVQRKKCAKKVQKNVRKKYGGT
jgi:hypothetical protein|tara:strand:+ start:87 stop:764 length:678 start_codon:yes stop_codon:yes gene_type:complete